MYKLFDWKTNYLLTYIEKSLKFQKFTNSSNQNTHNLKPIHLSLQIKTILMK
jgi:hypothetical protein